MRRIRETERDRDGDKERQKETDGEGVKASVVISLRIVVTLVFCSLFSDNTSPNPPRLVSPHCSFVRHAERFVFHACVKITEAFRTLKMYLLLQRSQETTGTSRNA